MNSTKAYSMLRLFEDTRKGIFAELSNNTTIDPYRRNLQRAYVNKMQELMNLQGNAYNQSDIKSIARGTLDALQADLAKNAKKQKDEVSKYHLEDLLKRVEKILGVE